MGLSVLSASRMSNPFLPHRIILGLTLGVGIGLSIIAAKFVGEQEASQQQTRFQQQIENLGTALQRSLNRYTDMLAFFSDHYVVSQLQVERQTFADFAARSLNTYPGVQALEWAPLIRQAERQTYEHSIQAEGYQAFQITELSSRNQLIRAGDRPYYIPVTYIAPFPSNEAAFGFDLNSNKERAEALQHAINTGAITATGRIRLVQEKRNQFGFLVVLPLYQSVSIPTTLKARQEQFEGVLLGVFRVSDVVEEALQDLSYEIDFVLYDQNAASDEQFLGRYDAITKDVITVQNDVQNNVQNDRPPSRTDPRTSILCLQEMDCTRTITVGQRQWLAVFSPSTRYAIGTHYGTSITLFIGLLLTSSLVLFLHNLRIELERTKNLSDLKLQFFSMASHELRTPLSTILLSAESLQTNRNELSEEQKLANIQRVHLTAKRMSQQITDLLTLTQAEAGKLEFNPELLDLAHFCQRIIEEIQIGVNHPILFIHHCQNTKAFWDKKLVRSLLTNLLSNAIKYSPNNAPVQVTLSCNSQTATLQVSDRGIGIPVSEQTQIWEAFRRGSNIGEVTGSGLGLAVVKTCVDLHCGEAIIDSEAGKGTTITVKLPLE